MGTFIPRSLRFEGYETRDIRESFRDNKCDLILHRRHDRPFLCYRCGCQLLSKTSQHKLTLRHLPWMGLACFIHLWRWKGRCPKCRKIRSEALDMVALETPHMTQDFAWSLGKLCEIAAVNRAAEYSGTEEMTTWRVDFRRMKMMLQYYKIPKVTHLAVDEVYARKKGKPGESRSKKFFTIITDIKTRRVIWVSESRDKEALDEFFRIIGSEACRQIRVVAMDQHEPYRASVRENCPGAKVVWDRFHIMQSFNQIVDTIRREILQYSGNPELKKLLRGKYRFIFLKRDTLRTTEERKHLDAVAKENEIFIKLELVKERLISLFDEPNEQEAYLTFYQIGAWISELGFTYLIDWWVRLRDQWGTFKNYFACRVTTAISEGINNVIKTLKRKAYGYRNMDYFRLKIMQTVGYLNSRFIPNLEALYNPHKIEENLL